MRMIVLTYPVSSPRKRGSLHSVEIKFPAFAGVTPLFLEAT